MSIENNKLMNLADGKVLYDDLRGRVENVLEDIAPDYSELTFPVAKDTPCVHEGVIYRAGQDIQNSEIWTAAHWVAVANVMSEVDGLKSAIGAVEESIAPIETSTTATAAHAVGELFVCGDTLMVALSAIAVGDTITTTGATPNAAVTSLSAKIIKDVQVNGTSVLSNGVANVPIGSSDEFGVYKTNYLNGIAKDSSGTLAISGASEQQIKQGVETRKPITTYYQHNATFYGLAKAAGADLKDVSGVTVGNYTDAAKVAIQKMLGIYEAPWELIRGDNQTNATEEDIEITVDRDGNAFGLTDIILTFWLDSSSVASSKGSYGAIYFYYDSNSYDTIYVGAWTQAVGATTRIAYAILEQKDGMLFKSEGENTTSGSQSAIKVIASVPTSEIQYPFIIPATKRIYNKIVIKKVTGKGCYRIFGKRKWN